jgi:hypothetical protein
MMAINELVMLALRFAPTRCARPQEMINSFTVIVA